MRARSLALGLVAVAALGIAVRLAPLAGFAVWGSDTGEYHRITQELLRDGRISLDYPGWGIAYPWFPGLYAVAGGVSAMTGLDTRASLEVLVPALAGLCSLGVALLAYALFRRGDAALLAGGAVAVAMPHAFATSHAMPGALGHLLLLAALLLAWRAERSWAFMAAFALAAMALVATHHLSTYMFLLALGGAIGVRALLSARSPPGHFRACGALGFTLLLSVAWWSWAAPIREQIAPRASALGVAGLALVALAGAAMLWLLPRARARWTWRFRPAHPPVRQGLRLVAAMFVVVLAGCALVGLVRIPGTSVQVTPFAVLWFLPLVVLLAWGFLGSQRAKFRPRGSAVYGWALGVLASFAVMMVLGSTVLLPYRHVEYILEAAAVLAGGGLAVGIAAAPSVWKRPAAVGAVGLLLLNGALAYPPPDVLAGFQEGTTRAEMDAVAWAGANLRLAPDAVIAADHRMSSMLFGYAGLDATWEYAPRTFHAATFEEARAEMQAVQSPSGLKRVDAVFLSRAMREGLTLEQWEPALPMSPAAQAKFDRDPHYVPLCRSPDVVIFHVTWDAGSPAGAVPACAP